MSPSPPEPAKVSSYGAVVSTEELFGSRREVIIKHGKEEYRADPDQIVASQHRTAARAVPASD
jgi:hypothetical protein